MGGVSRQSQHLRTGSQRRHEELHLVDKVSALHLAPMDLFVRPSEVAPLGVLDDVALWQLFDLAARELHQNFAAALWAVTYWREKKLWWKTTDGYLLCCIMIKSCWADLLFLNNDNKVSLLSRHTLFFRVYRYSVWVLHGNRFMMHFNDVWRDEVSQRFPNLYQPVCLILSNFPWTDRLGVVLIYYISFCLFFKKKKPQNLYM